MHGNGKMFTDRRPAPRPRLGRNRRTGFQLKNAGGESTGGVEKKKQEKESTILLHAMSTPSKWSVALTTAMSSKEARRLIDGSVLQNKQLARSVAQQEELFLLLFRSFSLDKSHLFAP